MPARLLTIGVSHYCEKARWGLDESKRLYLARFGAAALEAEQRYDEGLGIDVPRVVYVLGWDRKLDAGSLYGALAVSLLDGSIGREPSALTSSASGTSRASHFGPAPQRRSRR